jgi:DegV family protein with EDD domain
MSVQIIVDSTADLTPALKERVLTVPLTVHFGQEEYIDGVTIDHQTFYKKLVSGDTLPSTSQASPAGFEEKYQQVRSAGNSAVVITVASKVSGTYQSAVIAADGYENIHIVDSGSVAIGSGILTELALQLADAGLDAAQIADRLEEEKKKLRVVAVVDTLEYLKRGGRISKTVAFAGGLLNVKPLLGITDGEILILGKARGNKQANNQLLNEIEKSGGIDFSRPVMLGYTGLNDDLLRSFIAGSQDLWAPLPEVRTSIVGSVIGTHAGPGAVAVAYFCK